MIGRKDLIGDPRFDTGEARQEREPEIDEMIAAWTCRHVKREAMRVLAGAGVPAGAIFDTMELTDAIGAAPSIEIQKRPCFCLCPFRAHLVNDSAVNHFGAYAGGIAGDFDMEFHDRLPLLE